MNMRDYDTGKIIWRSADWDTNEMFTKEIIEVIPKEILKCQIVSREIVFSCVESVEKFR